MPAKVVVDLDDDDEHDEGVSAVEEELQSIEIAMDELRARRDVLRYKLASLRSSELRSTSSPSSPEWSDSGYPWDAKLRVAAKEFFGVTDFRENQLSILNALMSGADAVMVAPTGSGKSLVYQLPAIVMGTQAATAADKKMTVVVSPLISLMHDQFRYRR
ncbi:hypothetical protein FOZ60_008398 [Perkinsus olseni]|uniref:DNA 3'-5' helicase n=1 Tax=Perkinsus olseni TaxID=32597 RepID=A0A7J6NKD1_PEROL|nr:hypothetical protein FOZ60_008398 [Perkinsus olseni]